MKSRYAWTVANRASNKAHHRSTEAHLWRLECRWRLGRGVNYGKIARLGRIEDGGRYRFWRGLKP